MDRRDFISSSLAASALSLATAGDLLAQAVRAPRGKSTSVLAA